MAETFLDGRITLHAGDCRDSIRAMPDCSVDSVVCDPPYALDSIVKRFGGENAAPAQPGTDGAFNRASRGFMGQKWDTGEVAFDPEFWREVWRVMKPGAHLVAFSGTRTYHRMATAIEDAGFEIRDQMGWCYGSGMPKSHNVSKAIDKAAGQIGETIPTGKPVKRMVPGATQVKQGWEKTTGREYQPGDYVPATEDAREWEGWGTALKPAWEPICRARKPLIGTVAENVLTYGTGAINVGACGVPAGEGEPWRFPANILHDGSDEVMAAFPSAPGQQRAVGPQHGERKSVNCYGDYGPRSAAPPRSGQGSAARFFYSAKAQADDRLGSKHPTVKPVDLMRWLVRLVTPKGGTTLDPFAGTGTTGAAAFWEGCNAVLCERETAYQDDIRRRAAYLLAGPDERRRIIAKLKAEEAEEDIPPLFAALARAE